MRERYGQPYISLFTCPHCGINDLEYLGYSLSEDFSSRYNCTVPAELELAVCKRCWAGSLWFDSELIYPLAEHSPEPHSDLPNDVRVIFEEARSIRDASPRAAAALLRLAVERLCHHLGGTGKLNDCIGHLVNQGLSERAQKVFDIVRLVGNDAVHPGQIDIKDNAQIVDQLFILINSIAAEVIMLQRITHEAYAGLPESKRAEIRKRDKRA